MTTNTWEDLLRHVMLAGEERTDRTNTGTISVFSPAPLTYNLAGMRVPLVTTKYVPWRMATAELMWMLSGSTDINELENAAMRKIWSNWAQPNGDVGPTYGAQYRNAGGSLVPTGIDQITQVVNRLIDTPDTRRALISLWSAPELATMGIEPCMVLFQFSLRGPNLDKLHLHVYQRSADLMLGVPFDLYQAALLAHLIAREIGLRGGKYVEATTMTWTAGDAHIYTSQLEAVREVLNNERDARRMTARVELPPLAHSVSIINNTLRASSINVTDYHSAGVVTAPLAV